MPEEKNPREPAAAAEKMRSFKMDRRSAQAAKLRAAVSEKLFEFLGNYSDDVLAEYIVVLVCNGKHQNQARDDLEAFLGKESGKFVAWLWDHLSKEINDSKSPCDNSALKTEVVCDHDNSLDKKDKTSSPADSHIPDALLSKNGLCKEKNFSTFFSHSNMVGTSDGLQHWCLSAPVNEVHTERSRTQTHGAHERPFAADDNCSGPTKYLPSGPRCSSDITSGGEQSLQFESLHQKIAKCNSSSVPSRPLVVSKTEPVVRKIQSIVRDDLETGSVLMRHAGGKRLPSTAMDVEGHQFTRPRRNVWDRLGKPCEEDDALMRKVTHRHNLDVKGETMDHHGEEHRKPILMRLEPDAKLSGILTGKSAVLDKGCQKVASSCNVNKCGTQEHNFNTVALLEPMDHSKRKRQYDEIGSGNISASFPGCKENHLQDKEAFPKLQGSLPIKYKRLQSLNEFTAEAKCTTMLFPEQRHSEKSSKSDSQCDIVSQSQRSSASTRRQNSIPVSSSTQPKSESVSNAENGNGNNKPVQDKMLDVKLKLRQLEMDMLKLRSKQAEKNNARPNTPSGVRNQSEDDLDSRTVLVTNVHFAASREALLAHFSKCGVIVKVVMLTDTITGQPKGAAYIVFASKESVNKAVSLSGTSFFSRILTVMPKAEMPSGFLVPSLPTGKPMQQPWYPQVHKKGPIQHQYSSSHLQWRRDQSASRENSIPPTTSGLESSNAGE